MADANPSAVFSRGPVLGWCFVSTAETSSTAPKNVELLVDGRNFPNGVVLKDFSAAGIGVSAADRITLWLEPPQFPKFPWRDFLMAAAPTLDASNKRAYTYHSLENYFTLPAGWSVWASCYAGEDFYVTAPAAHFERDNPS